MTFGIPRVHLRVTSSTNERARELAAAGAPHGAVVTASSQTAGRGRQGRSWSAPTGRALLCSVLLRTPPRLLPLAGGVAVAEAIEELGIAGAKIKWPNDVLIEGRKVAGILVEGRPQEGWAVLGVGLNVALAADDFPPELRERAGTLGLDTDAIETALELLLGGLERWVSAPEGELLGAVRARDALLDKHVRWAGGEGHGAGIDGDGRLVVSTAEGSVALDAGEVHLLGAPCARGDASDRGRHPGGFDRPGLR